MNQPPRLLYIGDVPVESSYHGSALLYRLLAQYPADRLRIIEGTIYRSRADRRLPGVVYRETHSGHRRLLNTRLHAWYSLWLTFASRRWARRVPALLRGPSPEDFKPDAILTVAHNHLWVTAANYAAHLRLPLHLIVHDDWPRASRLPTPFGERVERQFGAVYRGAASRLCVSPYMEESYRARYGVAGTVLLPSRARDTPILVGERGRRSPAGQGLTYAFAGTLNTPGYLRALRDLSECLLQTGGTLQIFGPTEESDLRAAGLTLANTRCRGLLPADELLSVLAQEADVLFLPMSFAAEDRSNMELAFPSKLADYTATGLPILVRGPSTCSAVHWVRANPGAAEVVDDEGQDALVQAVHRLASDPAYRESLALRARSAGDRDFAQTAAQSRLFSALARSHDQGATRGTQSVQRSPG